jgi:hypothetical protein
MLLDRLNRGTLVVQFANLEKYEFVTGKDDIPCTMENKKCLKVEDEDFEDDSLERMTIR